MSLTIEYHMLHMCVQALIVHLSLISLSLAVEQARVEVELRLMRLLYAKKMNSNFECIYLCENNPGFTLESLLFSPHSSILFI